MGSIINFVVNEAMVKKWFSMYGEIPTCQICKEKFQIGDKVESKRSGKMNTRRFHEDCMESVPRVPSSFRSVTDE